MSLNIVFSTFTFWPGVETCLNNIANVVSENYPGSEINHLNFSSGNFSFGFIRTLRNIKPDFLFLGGWDENIMMMAQNSPKSSKKVLMWCSPIAQVELGGEITRFMEVLNALERGIIDYLAVPVFSDYIALKELNSKIIFIPIYMDIDSLNQYKIDTQSIVSERDNFFDFDIFCAPCSRKNILAQISALSKFKNKAKLHVNYDINTSTSPYLDFATRIFGDDFINYKWLSRQEYLEKVQFMDFGLQVSLSESFNYVAAEHMYFKKPCLISKCVPYSSDKRISPLVIKNNQDVNEIMEKINWLFSLGEDVENIAKKCKETIVDFCDESKNNISESLNSIFEEKIQ